VADSEDCKGRSTPHPPLFPKKKKYHQKRERKEKENENERATRTFEKCSIYYTCHFKP
jgi:hypothetical protein